MTQAKDIAKKLRAFLNDNQFTLSDLRRGMVTLSNGRLSEGKDNTAPPRQKPVTGAIRAIKPALEQEFCQS